MEKRYLYDPQTGKLIVEGISTSYEQELAKRPEPVPTMPAKEKYVILSSGGGAETWTARIVEKIAYNWYTVQPVCLTGEPGTLPMDIGKTRTACNMAEDFLYQGTLPPYTYIVMWHVGDYYVFNRKP